MKSIIERLKEDWGSVDPDESEMPSFFKLCLKNLPRRTTKQAVLSIFEERGIVLNDVFFAKRMHHLKTQTCFVVISTKYSCEEVINKIDNLLYKNHNLNLALFVPLAC